MERRGSDLKPQTDKHKRGRNIRQNGHIAGP